MDINPIVLPSWLTEKSVFQQGVELVINGYAAPSATITLEIVKDPTDGRRVSKLDTEYGVILSLETTTSGKGRFEFKVPPYKASTDTYTFIFTCFSENVTIKDIRCGDVWVFLGSELLSVPICKANAPAAPMKRNVMSLIRFLTPQRNGLNDEMKDLPYEPKSYYKDVSWIKVTDTKELSLVSSSAFSFAYELAEQIHYPVGVVDLSCADSTILSWICKEATEHEVALHDLLESQGLLIDKNTYEALLDEDKERNQIAKLTTEIKENKEVMDFDLEKKGRLQELTNEDNDGSTLDFPNSGSDKKDDKKTSEPLSASAAMSLDFNLFGKETSSKKKEEVRYIKPKFRVSTMYNAKLAPLSRLTIRGMCFAPNNEEWKFSRYDLLLMGLLETLVSVFEPKEVMEDDLMPSFFVVAMHPDAVDIDEPYSVLEFNENLTAFLRRLTMPTGIVSCHDLLLPDKTKSFTLGKRLSVVALGNHFTQKMPKSCPECIGAERAGNKLILSFDNLADGLRLAENESILRGFSVCGEDRVFYPAKAKILHGVRVMVWRDDIREPTSVTYGFNPFPHEATFKNLMDLPVLPFRFDRDPAFYSPDLFFASCDNLTFVGKKTRDDEFERLKVFRTFKGNGAIDVDTMNKTEGSSSLHIKYETENSLYGFEPVLSYSSIMGPLELPRRRRISIDVFNPEQTKKKLRIEGFKGEADIKQQLTWQTLILDYEGEGNIKLDELKIYIEDSSRNGEIYIDNIIFI
ncbi:MAG: hypothetical protein J6U23_06725 [Clostridiales bacterium]|nr:hypothetical protein [Clostridiales bacterium]